MTSSPGAPLTDHGPAQPDATFDVVVIGAGPVGENVADRAGRTGLSVAIVESRLVGGECSYWACMPSKALLRPGAVIAEAAEVPGVDVSTTIDAEAVFAWRDEVTKGWDDAGQVQWLDGAGIALLRGWGRLAGERRVAVEAGDGSVQLVEARHAVVVATGSTAVIPPVPGIADAEPWTSHQATESRTVPPSLVVIGGGVVGVEMADAYTSLGSTVTLLSRGSLLGSMEPFAGESVRKALEIGGVRVVIGADTRAVSRGDDGSFAITYAVDGSEHTVEAAELLVATGRRPATAGLGLDTVGLAGFDDQPGLALAVDDQTEVLGIPGGWLYAAGDVTGEVGTTHQGKYQGRVAGDVIAARFGDGRSEAPTADVTPPQPGAVPEQWSRYATTANDVAQTQAVFTWRQVASVGLTEQAARDAGIEVRAVRVGMNSAAGASVTGRGYEGTAQIVVDETRRVIIGATFVGPDAAELLHAATVAVVGEVPLDRLWHAVPAYPTVSEVWLRLLEAYGL